jgi:hypothetical protein
MSLEELRLLRWQKAKLEARLREAEEVINGTVEIIHRSGYEDIYNWGAPLREIRAAINNYKAKYQKDENGHS